MKKCLSILSFLILVTFFNCEDSSVTPEGCALKVNNDTTSINIKVLFIGNSHTYTYDIPQTIEQMAISKGDSVQTHKETPGGYTLRQHSMRQETFNAIKSERWDFVILQGSGGLQAIPPFMADTAFNRYAQILADSIWENWDNTKIILYMTHGYKEGVLSFHDYEWCEIDPVVCSYGGMQERIRYNYLTLSDLLNAEIAPSGMMWKIFMDKYPEINLYQSDGIHATPCGSYIAACAIYSLIFKKKPENIYKPQNISEEEALKIQSTVSSALYGCNPDWKIY